MIEAMKQALEALEGFIPYLPLKDKTQCNRYDRAITSLRQAIAKLESQEPVECDEDFPEGFDKSLGIPAQALRQANAALCEVTNNRMWDVPALAERMLMFCRNTHPQPKREPLTYERIDEIWQPQRTWQGLTKEQLATTDWSADFRAGALWAEAKLKEKNT